METFILKVAEMRRLQKEYFRSRDPYTLRAAKEAEREIDTFLELGKYTKKEAEPDASQPQLF